MRLLASNLTRNNLHSAWSPIARSRLLLSSSPRPFWHALLKAGCCSSAIHLRACFGTAPVLKMKVECQCGSVAFDTPQSSPMSVYHCHCTECQKQSSSAFGTSALFPADAIFPLSDELRSKIDVWTRPAKENRSMDCYFCKECGVRIFHRIRNTDGTERPTISVKGGLVEGLDWSKAKHIYTRSAVVPIPAGVERWEATPEVMEGRDSKQ